MCLESPETWSRWTRWLSLPYIFTALDVSTRFAFAYAYKANSSANARDFIGKFLKVAPFVTRRVQTDNGSEFAKHFDDPDKSGHELTHFFNYPRHPESNGFLERFNRTVQEQCVNHYLDYLDEPDDPDKSGLMDYLIWYPSKEGPRNPTGVLAKSPRCATILITSSPLKSPICYGRLQKVEV